MSKKYDRLNNRVGKLEKKIFGRVPWQCRSSNLTGTAGDCTCVSGVVGDDCPLHPMTEKARYRALHEVAKDVAKEYHQFAHPDPLHVRVAKALGEEVMMKSGKWFTKVISNDLREFPGGFIPDYPNDLVAAMGALEEYCRKRRLIWAIRPPTNDSAYWDIFDLQSKSQIFCTYNAKTASQAICEAIMSYAEQNG